MVTYKRNIKFYYYQATVMSLDKNTKEYKETGRLFNVPKWLDQLQRDGSYRHNVELKNSVVYLDECVERDRYNIFRIYRIRDNAPAKIKEGEQAEPLELADDEYVGEDINILYDPNFGVCMIQYNRMSVSISGLSEFMSKYLQSGEKVHLNPIYDKKDLKRYQKAHFRKLEVTFANTEELKGTSKALNSMLGNIGKFQGVTATISIGTGRVKDRELANDVVVDVIQEIQENAGAISSAKVKMLEDDMPRMEVVDLFDNLLNDIVSFDVEVKQPLNFDDVKVKMLSTYINREKLIDSKVGAAISD